MIYLLDNDEVAMYWCLGLTWRCTRSEMIGIWSVLFFYTSALLITFIHLLANPTSNAISSSRASPPPATAYSHRRTNDDDYKSLCMLLGYFFTFVLGCLLWVTVGVQAVHPVQIWQVQLLGVGLLMLCTVLFAISHLNMGDNWSPVPERKDNHQLVTAGLFRFARHPMYAILLWATVGTLLATLNWLIAWIVLGFAGFTIRRIETEEHIMVELFGDRYKEYRQQVSALGPPWGCLGYDKGLQMEGYNAIN